MKLYGYNGNPGEPDGGPHARTIELVSPIDVAAYASLKDRDAGLGPAQESSWIKVTDGVTGKPVELRTAPCGLGCRCAAEIRDLNLEHDDTKLMERRRAGVSA